MTYSVSWVSSEANSCGICAAAWVPLTAQASDVGQVFAALSATPWTAPQVSVQVLECTGRSDWHEG